MANTINIVEMQEGNHIDYALVAGKKIIFGDDDLTVNLSTRERDNKVILDICKDTNGNLTLGTGGAMSYVAQVEIPGRTYEEVPDEESEEGGNKLVPVPFDMSKCTLYLWRLED